METFCQLIEGVCQNLDDLIAEAQEQIQFAEDLERAEWEGMQNGNS